MRHDRDPVIRPLLRLRRAVEPGEIITLAEAKAHSRVLHDDEDAVVAEKLAGAIGWIDGPDAWLGRALGEQTLAGSLDAFPRCRHDWIRIPLPPLVEIVSIAYVGQDGSAQTLAPSQVKLIPGGNWPSYLVPAFGTDWPVARCEPDAVTITFRAGYAAGQLPPAIRDGILLLAGNLFENREAVITGTIATEMPMGVANLLSPFRVWGF